MNEWEPDGADLGAMPRRLWALVVLVVLAVLVGAVVLAIDLGIKNQIVNEAQQLRRVMEREQRERAGAAGTATGSAGPGVPSANGVAGADPAAHPGAAQDAGVADPAPGDGGRRPPRRGAGDAPRAGDG